MFDSCEGSIGDIVVFLGNTLYSYSVSFHLGVQMGTGKFNAGSNPAMDQLPIQGDQERSRNTPSHCMLCRGTRDSAGLMDLTGLNHGIGI